jgi:hypothetical protein
VLKRKEKEIFDFRQGNELQSPRDFCRSDMRSIRSREFPAIQQFLAGSSSLIVDEAELSA